MIPTERLNEIIQRFECLEAKLNSNPELNELKSLGQEYHELRPVIEKIGRPDTLFLISTSLNCNLFLIPTALKRASFAANRLAKH